MGDIQRFSQTTEIIGNLLMFVVLLPGYAHTRVTANSKALIFFFEIFVCVFSCARNSSCDCLPVRLFFFQFPVCLNSGSNFAPNHKNSVPGSELFLFWLGHRIYASEENIGFSASLAIFWQRQTRQKNALFLEFSKSSCRTF